MRDLARGLHPAVLTAWGLGAALEDLAARALVRVQVIDGVERRLDAAIETAAYYVVSESLANIAKHAGAESATVTTAYRDGALAVEVADDGVGGADATSGSGLRGLEDRVRALEGTLRISSPRGAGTTICAEFPCRPL